MIKMNSLKLKVKVEMGLQSDNPIIEVYSHTDICMVVRAFTRDWALPPMTTEVILEQIRQELGRNGMQWEDWVLEGKDQDSTFIEEQKDHGGNNVNTHASSHSTFPDNSPIKHINLTPYTPYHRLKSLFCAGSEVEGAWTNQSKLVNSDDKTTNHNDNKCSSTTNLNKISFTGLIQCKIREVYQMLYTCLKQEQNSPHRMNLSLQTFSPELLQCLLSFFQCLSEGDFDHMSEEKFLSLVQSYKYKHKIYQYYVGER